VDYDTPKWSVRFGEALMPTVANGMDMDWHIDRARAENLEFEFHPASGLAVRVLGYANHANMGSYDEAITSFLAGREPTPDIVAHRQPGRLKTGFGVNTEYTRPSYVRVFARAGWNEGHNESFAYTEVNNSAQAGGDLNRSRSWRRHQNRAVIRSRRRRPAHGRRRGQKHLTQHGSNPAPTFTRRGSSLGARRTSA